MKTILYPFKYDAEFKVGYSWAAELASRIKGELLLFTTLRDTTLGHFSALYKELIKAREFHIRNVGELQMHKKPVPLRRNFLKGDFETTFLHFLEENQYDVLVLPNELVSPAIMTTLINSDKHIIALPALEPEAVENGTKAISRDDLFVQILQRSNCYNLPSSFYKTVSEDKRLFNSIASFFRRRG